VITTGEGGMVLCDDEKIALKCRRLRNLGFEETGRRFIHKELGWNYRMTNMQAALGLAQLEHLEVHLERKKKIGSIYQCRLSKLKGFQLPLPSTFYAENIYWIFGLVAENELKANRMVEWLNRNGIGTRPFFWCMHEQPVFKEMQLFREERYVEAEKLARNGFYIPSGLGITDAELEYVAEKMLEFED
jgi:perosamine synthetase